MDVLTAILTCGLYVDDNLTFAIARSNSQGNPYFVADASSNVADVAQVDAAPKTLNEAIARAEDIGSSRGRPLLGLMQVPESWMTQFGRSMRDAFDPCINVSIGTAMLSQFAYECGRKSKARNVQRIRPCVLKSYAEIIGMPEFETVITLELQFQRPTIFASADAPILPVQRDRGWGPESIFVSLTEGERTP